MSNRRLFFWLWLFSLLITVATAFFLFWPVVTLHLHNWVLVKIPFSDPTPQDGVHHHYLADISADGRYVVFATAAADLFHGQTDNATQLYLWDRESRHTRRLRLKGVGREEFGQPAISADGRAVAVVARTGLAFWQLYLFDTQTGESDSIGEVNRFTKPVISADGHLIAYYENLFNLVVYDQRTQSAVTLTPDLIENGRYFLHQHNPFQPLGPLHLSADGRYLALAAELTTELACTTVIYDLNQNNVVFQLPSCPDFALTRDGRYLITRQNYGHNQFGNPVSDLTVQAWQTDETRRINDSGTLKAVSADGHIILYRSLRGGDIAWSDLTGGAVKNPPVECQASNDSAFHNGCTQALSADGRIIVFSSYASDLVPDDLNFANDLFVYDETQATIQRISPTPWLGNLFVILLFLDVAGPLHLYHRRMQRKEPAARAGKIA